MRIGRRDVPVTNLDKVYVPKPGLTKGDLIAYYGGVAPVRIDDLERPDYLLIDLDPSHGNPWSHVREIAMVVNEVMDEQGMWRRRVSLGPRFERLGLEAPAP